jgi:tRNA G18 (ribose-2'-O)-methylase SpoU
VIERITGLDDPRVEDYAQVANPVWLAARGLFVAEGRLVVRRLVEDAALRIESILVTPSSAAGLDDVLRVAAARCAVYLCSQEEMDATCGINFHRGCLALAHRPILPTVSAFASARMLVALEQVGNPDNVGSIFRNALAFGVDGVILDRRSADPLYRKAIRTSMAAVLRIPFARVDDWPAAMQWLREAGFTIVALTPDPGAQDIGAIEGPAVPARTVLLLGSEGDGLSPATLADADLRLRIPIAPRADSLNVAVAAGIALHRLASALR